MTYRKDIDIDHLAHLCRIKLMDDEKEILGQSLDKILDYMNLLDEVSTVDVAPCTSILETSQNVMREDEIGKTLPREVFLQNAPKHVGSMIKVPPIIQFEE